MKAMIYESTNRSFTLLKTAFAFFAISFGVTSMANATGPYYCERCDGDICIPVEPIEGFETCWFDDDGCREAGLMCS